MMHQQKTGTLTRLHQSLLAAGLGILMAAGMSVSPVFAATTAKTEHVKEVPANKATTKTEHAKEMPAKTTTSKTAHEAKVPAKHATSKTASK